MNEERVWDLVIISLYYPIVNSAVSTQDFAQSHWLRNKTSVFILSGNNHFVEIIALICLQTERVFLSHILSSSTVFESSAYFSTIFSHASAVIFCKYSTRIKFNRNFNYVYFDISRCKY